MVMKMKKKKRSVNMNYIKEVVEKVLPVAIGEEAEAYIPIWIERINKL